MPLLSTKQLLTRHARAWRVPCFVGSVFDPRSVDTIALSSLEEACTPRTRFPLASVTKTFTAGLVLNAARAGRVDLDAPLRDQLPGFALCDPHAAAAMTPRDALCHHSGLPPHTWAWVFSRESRDAFLRNRLPRLSHAGPHRAFHRYSNLLYAVLGRLLEVAGPHPDWETAVSREILEPLGMRDTGHLTANWAGSPDVAAPHADGSLPRPIPHFVARAGHPVAPASELIGTVPDLARWGQAMLELACDDPRWEPHNVVVSSRPRGLGPLHYGLGWRLERIAGRKRVWHSGQCSGYSVLLSLYPEEGTGIALAANRSGCVDALHAMDFSLNLNVDGLVLFPPSAPPPVPALAAALRPVGAGRIPCGAYYHPGYGSLELMDRGGEAWVSFQETDPVPLREDSTGNVMFSLPVYGARFPLRWKDGAVGIPFEPAFPDVVFHADSRDGSLSRPGGTSKCRG